MAVTAARNEIIEGTPTLVVERRPPLPQGLPALLGALQLVTRREDIVPGGTSVRCEQREHRFGVLREGRHVGLDGVVRDLRIEMCRDCGATCVRDISYDRLAGLPVGRRGPQRRDMVIGWYSGARRNRREYR